MTGPTMMRILVLAFLGLVVTGAPADAKRVAVTKTRLVLTQPIYFDVGKDTIKSDSFQLLDEVAAAIKADKKIGLVEIGVHTDARGRKEWNRKLSEQRAQAIYRYLIDRGVEASRLRAKGYGESRPLDRRPNAAAWARNRRVEFLILQRITT